MSDFREMLFSDTIKPLNWQDLQAKDEAKKLKDYAETFVPNSTTMYELELEDVYEHVFGDDAINRYSHDELITRLDEMYDAYHESEDNSNTDWVILTANDKLLSFSNGDLVVYGDKSEAKEDMCKGDMLIPYNLGAYKEEKN